MLALVKPLPMLPVWQPGISNISAGITANTPGNPNETINYSGPLVPGTNISVGGSPNGTPLPDFFGQKFATNNLTMTWDGSERATFSLTYRYGLQIIAQGDPHSAPLTLGSVTNGTFTVHENGGIFNVSVRPSSKLNLDGSAELMYHDNAFTPVNSREMQHYRVHLLYRPRPWATVAGSYNDREQHNNTNNNQAAVAAHLFTYDGPIAHVDHSRVASAGLTLAPNEFFGLDLNYTYSDVYTATNICYDAAASSTLPGAATPSGTACPGATVRGATYYEFGPAKDFEDAPTQYGTAAISLAPLPAIHLRAGYTINDVNGTRFYNDARDVAGSLVSKYQTPFVNAAWRVRKGWIWNAQYNYYGYGEGGPSGAPYCSTSNPTPGHPVAVVPCNSPTLTGLQTGLTLSPAGETAPRVFHANVVTLGMHYEF
jgi:hypothetical protein